MRAKRPGLTIIFRFGGCTDFKAFLLSKKGSTCLGFFVIVLEARRLEFGTSDSEAATD